MNKEKLILDTIKEKAYGVNPMQHPVYGHGQYDMAYEILDAVQKIIQSEPEEICISKERLACILIDYAEYVEDLPNGWACDQTIEDALEWLNQKAGE